MSNASILERVINLFSMMTDADEVTAESEIVEDLEISSMDVLFLISNLEAEFKIKVPEKEVRKMVVVSDVADAVERLIG